MTCSLAPPRLRRIFLRHQNAGLAAGPCIEGNGQDARQERMAPLRASSPTMTKFSSWSVSNCSLAARIPNAMGRSKLGPSFLTSAGARLMVVRPMGNLKPELVRAVETRSRDSLTAAFRQAQENDEGVPIAGIDLNFHRIRLNAIDGGGAHLCKHEAPYQEPRRQGNHWFSWKALKNRQKLGKQQ